jgi:putative PIN family toxin of toxin-antitoxin system
MPKAVLDTTVLVSAFLRRLQGGASFELLRLVEEGAFELYTSNEILAEVANVLINRGHIRQRYRYMNTAVVEFCKGIGRLSVIVSEVPEVKAVRDPNDDMVVGCALAAGADYIVTRDKDLLSLREYRGITIIRPEDFLPVLRART